MTIVDYWDIIFHYITGWWLSHPSKQSVGMIRNSQYITQHIRLCIPTIIHTSHHIYIYVYSYTHMYIYIHIQNPNLSPCHSMSLYIYIICIISIYIYNYIIYIDRWIRLIHRQNDPTPTPIPSLGIPDGAGAPDLHGDAALPHLDDANLVVGEGEAWKISP